MESKKQSSIEWLWKWIMDNPLGSFEDGVKAYNKAQELHKQEIINAWYDGEVYMDSGKNGNEYYNDTYEQ